MTVYPLDGGGTNRAVARKFHLVSALNAFSKIYKKSFKIAAVHTFKIALSDCIVAYGRVDGTQHFLIRPAEDCRSNSDIDYLVGTILMDLINPGGS